MVDISGYEGLYAVTSCGKIWSYVSNKFLRPCYDKNGYILVTLHKDKRLKTFKVHRLVAQAYISNPNNLPQINHKDENIRNNCVNNLEWCTSKYNCNYGSRNSRIAEKESREVHQYSKDGKLIAIYKNTKIASEKAGIGRANIISVCSNDNRHTAGGYVFKYGKE